MNLNEFLAVEVMGLAVCEIFEPQRDASYAWYVDGSDAIERVDQWNPTENIEQAMMCLEAKSIELIRLSLNKGEEGDWIATVDTGMGFFVTGMCKSPAEAISLACAKARGWNDE